MRRKVVFTPTALHDLSRSRQWLEQAGSGSRSKTVARRLLRAARQLVTTAGSHPKDRFFPDSHQLVVADYVIRYVIVVSAADELVSIERIYGPGQDRSSRPAV